MATRAAAESGIGASTSTTICAVGVTWSDTMATVRSGAAARRTGAAAAPSRSNASSTSTDALGAVTESSSGDSCDVQVGDDRSSLLRKTCLIESADVAAVEERGHAQDLADGDHSGAADPHQAHAHVGRCRPRLRLWKIEVGRPTGRATSGVLRREHGEERGAISLEAGVVLVATRLVDAVLRPNSVSTGSTERQLDFSPQSPHPSQTRSLISTRRGGSGARPRLRSRRSSAAQAWSCSSTVTP